MEGKRYGPPYGMQLNAKNGQIFFFFFFFFGVLEKFNLIKMNKKDFFLFSKLLKINLFVIDKNII
jgi:hypothetical protein